MPDTYRLDGRIVTREQYLDHFPPEQHVRFEPVDVRDDFCRACGHTWPCDVALKRNLAASTPKDATDA